MKSRLKKIVASEEDMNVDEIYNEIKNALNSMRRRVNEWNVRDELLKLTQFGFYNGSAMGSIDEQTAKDIINQTEAYIEEIKGNEEALQEIYDIVYRYA